MASASRTEVVDVDINKLYDVIVDYAKYPDFVDGVSSTKVLSQNETSAKVEYSVNLIKSFKYTLATTQSRPTKVSWVLESGDLFKKNDGNWTLKDLGNGKTEVTYTLEVDFKMFAPNAILSALTEKNLPVMMQSFFKRAKSV
ncbi:SRPBCC family protein [Bacteriovorax stolpii]|uniref:Cyclase n=1 Tax=Bacteriovorax stolpii TaxID=960 RepID=A0A2K9NSG9_BACTC|nr:SRPBCC family protein [Bacteriovorax stolpii]AUN98463.1 cyclase [Bacteriovorax stolpii]QDK41557.1 SRPBCC family protein [Bacteriovorax stolpii]TDP50912.1 ribosome-associated toxin RatA of RatAB toxin-antitoxin module [Bacteriovorax stolpii]